MTNAKRTRGSASEHRFATDPVDVALEAALEAAEDDRVARLIRRAQQQRIILQERSR